MSFDSCEYRRYDRTATGVSPTWIPLRFPGQYYDEETDLFENWHRYYDPGSGRYLSVEPLMQMPGHIETAAVSGRSIQPYAYANNNPLAYIDPTGLCAQ